MGVNASKKHEGEEDSSEENSHTDLQLQQAVEEFRQQWNDAFATLQRELDRKGAGSRARQALQSLKEAHEKVESLAASLHCQNQALKAELEMMRGQVELLEGKMQKMALHVEERDADVKRALGGLQQQILDLQAAKAAATAAPEKATEAVQAADKAADTLADQVAKLLVACPNFYYSKAAPAQAPHDLD